MTAFQSETAPSGRESSKTLYRGERVAAGAFRCPVGHSNFAHEGAMAGYEVVFPRTQVWIRRSDRPAFIADANLVTLYNAGQEYSRSPLSPLGDSSDWFSLDEASATEIVRTFDPEIDDPSCLLRHATAPGHPALYWRQRSLFEQLRAGPVADNLRVEEEVVWIFSAVVKRAYDARGSSTAIAPAPDHDAVSRTKAVLARRYREAMGLSELASEVGFSMYHLSRIFRRETGLPLHAWRMRLRLNEALNRLCEATSTDLSALSLELGFSSHSHFTAAFHRAFGVPPSTARKQLDKLRVVDTAARQRSI